MQIQADYIFFLGTVIAFFTALVGMIAALFEFKAAYDFKNIEHTSQTIANKAATEYIRQIREETGMKEIAEPFISINRNGLHLVLESGFIVDEHTIETKISDYAVGGYMLADAPSAAASVEFFRGALNDVLALNIETDIVADTRIVGSADGMQVLSGTKYKGDLGTITNFPYFSRDEGVEKRVSLDVSDPLSNEDIAFLRAFAVYAALSDVPLMQESVRIVAETTPEVGGKYRKVVIKMDLKNALAKRYTELSPLAKVIEKRL